MANAKGSLKCAICQAALDDHYVHVRRKIIKPTPGTAYDDFCDGLLDFFAGQLAVHRTCLKRLRAIRKVDSVGFFEN